jgi:hypothetical protein
LNVVLVPELEPLLPRPRDSSLQDCHRHRLLPPPHLQVPVGAALQDVSVSRAIDGREGGSKTSPVACTCWRCMLRQRGPP